MEGHWAAARDHNDPSDPSAAPPASEVREWHEDQSQNAQAVWITSAQPWPPGLGFYAAGGHGRQHRLWAESQALSSRNPRLRRPEPPCTRRGSALSWRAGNFRISCQFLKLLCQSTCPSFCIPGHPSLALLQSPCLLEGPAGHFRYSPAPWANPALSLCGAARGFVGGAAVHRAASFLHHPRGPLDSQVSCTASLCTCSSRGFSIQGASGSSIICLRGCLWWLLVSESKLVHHLDPRRLMGAPSPQ